MAMYSRCTPAAATRLFWILVSFSIAGCGSDKATGPPDASMDGGHGGQTADTGQSNERVPSTEGALERSSGPDSRRRSAAPSIELHPDVLITTSLGEITVRLDREKAPLTVENFLVGYVERLHYDNTVFHRVEEGFMVLGGGFTPDLAAKPTRTPVYNEAPNGLKNTRGTIAMARDPADRHSATCQFFFNLVDNPELDQQGRESDEEYGYCVFGKVVSGMEVVDRIAQVKVRESNGFKMLPAETVAIKSIRRIR